MNVKWRVHERLLVTGMVILGIGVVAARHIAQPYILLPKIGSLIFIYLCYIWINAGIVPGGGKSVIESKGLGLRVLNLCVQLLLLSYLLGPVVNFISFYAGLGYQVSGAIPLTFGFHPQPVQNLVGGWHISLGLLLCYFLYALIREQIIYTLEQQGQRRSYRIQVSNMATGLAIALVGLPLLIDAFWLANPAIYHYYFAIALPAGILLMGNYYWLFPAREGKGWQKPGSLLLLFLYVAALTALFSIFLGEEWSPGLLTAILALQLGITLPLSWFLYRSRKDSLLALRGSQAELARSNADLQALRAQINPHFLFNALNSLYATALRDGSADTATGIQRLGDMMRFMLHDNQLDLIPMSSELEYLDNYVALQKLRVEETEDRVIRVEVEDKDCGCLIAPMLLIPFVENAFKHGIRMERKSWIFVSLKCRDGLISYTVRNSLHPGLTNDTEGARPGIGLNNVRDRLRLSYPGKHQLHYGPHENEYVVTLQINAKS